MKKLFLFSTVLCLLYSCGKKDSSGPHNEPIYTENFSKGEGMGFWTGGKDEDSVKASLRDGFYQVINNHKEVGKWKIFSLNPVFIVDTGDVAVETRLAITPMNGLTLAHAGIVWGVDDRIFQRFIFGYFANGYFDIWGFVNGDTFKVYKNPTQCTALHKNGFNKLRIERKGENLHFLINETEVYSMPSNVTSLDRTGVIVSIHTKAQFDYFKAEALH